MWSVNQTLAVSRQRERQPALNALVAATIALVLFVLPGCGSAQRILLATGPPIALLRTTWDAELAWHFNVQIRV